MPAPTDNQHHADEPTVVDSKAADFAAEMGDTPQLPPGVPRKIGHYTLQSVIASGGMGTVYKAVQESPRRVVAIKIMKAGVASASALRRFEYEAQLLGRLRHAGIAQIYEAGTHQDGDTKLPWFAMEYIPNAREISAYVRQKKLGTRETLELFARACDAVHHGHQKGIVHRDLKPSNILISPSGDPKIIDFGVARATDSDLALTMMQTNVGQLVGTVQYMSPEQCDADPDDLDIRSDVYALGVTLYELLCGRLPYELDRAPIYEATRIIREHDPARPSTVNTSLRGDIETIVLKALEKERSRRYQSAADLARDLRHYLAGEAIMARPSSMIYQLLVFARRNRALVTGMAVVLAVLVVSAVAVTAAVFTAANNRLRAEQESLRAETERLRAEQEAARAEAESARHGQTQGVLHEILGSANPTDVGSVVEVTKLFDAYGAGLEQRFADQPLVEAQQRYQLAGAYMYMNLLEDTGRAEEHWATAMAHIDRALEIRRRELGDAHEKTIEAIELLAQFLGYGKDPQRAEDLRREVLDTRIRTAGADAPATLAAATRLSTLLRDRGKLIEAESLRREVYEICRRLHGDEAAETLDALADLASIRQQRGALEEAETMYRQRFDAAHRLFGPDSPPLQTAQSDLANVLVARGKLDEARALYQTRMYPDELQIQSWFNGEHDPSFDGPTILLFWEAWCPFSQVSVPGVQDLTRTYDDALQVLGLVGLTQNSTPNQAQWFIDRNELTFPNARTGNPVPWMRFVDRGIPTAVALLDHDVLWAGHPAAVRRTFLDGLVAAAPAAASSP